MAGLLADRLARERASELVREIVVVAMLLWAVTMTITSLAWRGAAADVAAC